jgi:hypothetical protein
MDAKDNQRTVIQFLLFEGRAGQEIMIRIRNVYGSAADCHASVFRWISEIRRGNEELRNERPPEDSEHVINFKIFIFISQQVFFEALPLLHSSPPIPPLSFFVYSVWMPFEFPLRFPPCPIRQVSVRWSPSFPFFRLLRISVKVPVLRPDGFEPVLSDTELRAFRMFQAKGRARKSRRNRDELKKREEKAAEDPRKGGSGESDQLLRG